MSHNVNQNLVTQRLQVLKVLLPAFCVAPIIILGVGSGGIIPLNQGEVNMPILMGLVGVAALMLIGSFNLKALLFKPSPTESLDQTLTKYINSQILSFAMKESLAILGLLGYLVAHSKETLWGLCAVSLAAMILDWPKQNGFEVFMRRQDLPE